jgi:hypothetical protein
MFSMVRRALGIASIASLIAACSPGALTPAGVSPFSMQAASGGGAYATAVKYVVTFYPLWFTYNQAKLATTNRLVGPDRMGPAFHEVVAPNDDTLYCSTFVDLSQEPLVVTIPTTKATFSLLSTDAYGDVFDTGIAASGTYALTGPGWNGTLPAGVTQVALPNDFSQMIIRSDKYAGDGTNQIAAAERFRKSLRAATLSAYESNPSSGRATLFPLAAYVIPWKSIADDTIEKNPMKFLKALQTAVASSNTPALSAKDKALSDAFDKFFNASNPDTAALSAGARRAHRMILDAYFSNTGKTNWITFSTIGTTWSDLVRSAITEFIQYGNSHSTAAYFQAFKDGRGRPLDGSSASYVLTFRKNEIPQAKRFWSLTAYTPRSITLISNSVKKYLVGSYTPGLQRKTDGSISIYMAPSQPSGVPAANWLPIPKGRFNVMLRVYGPEGTVASNTYVPPAVRAVP